MRRKQSQFLREISRALIRFWWMERKKNISFHILLIILNNNMLHSVENYDWCILHYTFQKTPVNNLVYIKTKNNITTTCLVSMSRKVGKLEVPWNLNSLVKRAEVNVWWSLYSHELVRGEVAYTYIFLLPILQYISTFCERYVMYICHKLRFLYIPNLLN